MEVVTQDTTSKKVWIYLGIILGVIIILASAYCVYASQYDKVYPHTYVGSIDLSGKDSDECIALLKDEYKESKLKGKKMLLSCNKSSSSFDIDNLSLTFGIDETVAELLNESNSGSFFERVAKYTHSLFNETKRNPVLIYDEQALQGAINDLVSGYEVEPVEFSYQIDDNLITINKPHAGIKVDRKRATEKIETEICNFSFNRVNMKLEETKPPVIDVDAFYKEITSEPVDAKYEKGEDGKVIVIPERRQCTVERSVIADAIKRIEAGEEVVTVKVVTSPANLTKADLEANLYSAELGSFSSYFGSSSAARASNVRLAASRINDIELMPGEIFSYNDAVGERTSANGFYTAHVYIGNKVEEGLGGGVCQPSSTLYSAALYANLEIVERTAHSLAVSYMPGGMDATVSYGSVDLKLKNSTEYPIKIVAITEGGTLTCKVLGYNPENYSVKIERSGGGLVYTVTRIVYKNGEEIKRENMGTTKYGVEEKEDEEEPTPSPSTEASENNSENTEAEPSNTTEEPQPEAEAPVAEATAVEAEVNEE